MRNFTKSEELLARALRSIPLGSQTFSKSYTQYPRGVSPYFIERGEGSHVWDVDGNEYIDFVNGLLAVSLGYNYPAVTQRVQEQMKNGVIFTLPHRLEVEVAEKIISMVPCAEMVRYGKNGSDVTTGAVRLARAFTGREHIATCGYHGWHDWYIGITTRNLGVPQSTQELTHTFEYNNLDSLREIFSQRPDGVAAVIMEPMNVTDPDPGFLEGVKDLAHQHGALLIFDEMITGFRFSNGGAQELFGVTPDLATFGKGLANGYPLSALTGRRDIMELITELFYSFTFGGETLSLAAASATLDLIKEQPVVETMIETGNTLITGLREIIDRHQLQEMVSVSGHPTWSFIIFKGYGEVTMWDQKTYFFQEMFERGILTMGTHNLSYSHSAEDISALLGHYDEVLPEIHALTLEGTLRQRLRCEPLVPLFTLR
ncbi:MAG: aminotransferase class III-fold pyridoxal phosphate-dependent enzyme [Candidatus Marinimicrobia bacterium]|nr:aminotransferase class III-fold pyridoxal phosphate-dependent enzyme [Candidatus Neomarinimicrobiota bacterium]